MQAVDSQLEYIKADRTGRQRARQLRVVIAGGTGQVGRILAQHFHARGDLVTVLARTTAKAPWRMVAWDAQNLSDWTRELENADVAINLAGRSVDCRYTHANKRAILESRVLSTRLLGEAIQHLKNPPSVWLNASTATIYRHTLDRAMDEETGEIGGKEADVPSSWHFSIEVATKWEEAFFGTQAPRTRKVALRSAMTMTTNRGGVFAAAVGAFWFWWWDGDGPAVCVMDSWARFCAGYRFLDCA